MYSVVDGVMLRPLPFVHPERLVAIWATEATMKTDKGSALAWNSVVIGKADYLALRERSRSPCQPVAAWSRDGGMFGDVAGGFEQVNGVRVTSSIFDLLGVRPVLGRAFRPDEDVLNGPHVVLLGWEVWQRRFGGDSNIIGRTVTFDDASYTVIGVMPPAVRLERTLPPAAVWFPAFQSSQDEPERHNRSYRGLGRLAAGATLAQANGEVAQIIADVKTAWKGKARRHIGAREQLAGRPGGRRARIAADSRRAVGLLLLIACVNVATLMFGEAARRQPEITARTALGATPARLARQLLTESLVIAGCGALFGLLLGWGLTRALVALAPAKIPGLADVRFDGRVFAFTAICAVVTGIAFGVLPTFVLLRWGQHSTARVGAGQTARGEQGIQRALVAIEVALSLVMLVGCSLLGRSLVRLSEVDPGFTPNGLIFVQVSAPMHLWADSASAEELSANRAARTARHSWRGGRERIQRRTLQREQQQFATQDRRPPVRRSRTQCSTACRAGRLLPYHARTDCCRPRFQRCRQHLHPARGDHFQR